MMCFTFAILQVTVLLLSVLGVGASSPPHIVLLVADDLGWNDVSWNNHDIDTPNLENLGSQGVFLNSSYVLPLCSPTRAAFLTGRYPYKYGLQNGVVSKDRPQFLTTNYSTLPEKLKEAGYATHMVGKWHLGHCDVSYTPTYRGFDNHRGLLLGAGDHFEHTTANGFDFRNNLNVDHSFDGIHSTDAYTQLAVDIIDNHNASEPLFLYVAYQAGHTPLQVVESYWQSYSNITNEERRNFSAMITHLDDSVGAIHQALSDNGLLDNLLLVFLSDNGGDVDKGGNNYPLRGLKGSIWEGAMRVPAFVYGPGLLSTTGYEHSGMIHAVDWYATFLDLAGVSTSSDIDGVSQWNMLNNGGNSSRTEFVYNIDAKSRSAAIRVGDYKLIEGRVGSNNLVYDVPSSRRRREEEEEEEEEESQDRFKRALRYRLYNIAEDPDESDDLSGTETSKLASMKLALEYYRNFEHPAIIPPIDSASKPRNYGGNWEWGWCTGGL